MSIKQDFDKCIIMGTGKFAFGCARFLQELYHLDGVYEYGSYGQSGLENLCRRAGIPYYRLGDKRECDALMRKISADGQRTFIVSASNTFIYPKFITENKNIKVINYHPGYLDKHLGRNAEAWAIYEQDCQAGVTWHEVTAQIDQGKILAESGIEIKEHMTALDLMIKQYQTGLVLFKELLTGGAGGQEICARKVRQYGKIHYSCDKPNCGILDLSWTPDKISAFLRSMDYGALNVMGRPFVVEKGVKYCWDSYRIIRDKCGEATLSEEKIIRGNHMILVLQGFREMKEV